MTQARSLHIGLNRVDPSVYNGWSGPLDGCINDANDMQSICAGLGMQTELLIDAQATSLAVVRAIGRAAQTLCAGDLFVLSYSGHGAQVRDTNGDEADGQDETWVLFDRMLIDDELSSLWSQFQAGVRIFLVSDSCHSGTVARMVGFDRMVVEATAMHRARTSSERTAAPERFRLMPPDRAQEVGTRDAPMYETLQWVAGARERATIDATVLLISGCQDHQLSADGQRNGLFTETLLRVWNRGAFQGTYAQFHRQIIQQMPANQTPNLLVIGATNAGFEAQRPFTLTAPPGTAPNPVAPPQPASPQPSAPPVDIQGGGGGSTRRTLRRGDRGPAVTELQRMLQQIGHQLLVDNVFGPSTEREVREFQAQERLPQDGIVGTKTWAALDAAVAGGGSTPQPTPGANHVAGDDGQEGPTLRRGSSGDDVVFLQTLLRELQFNVEADGDFGPRTESAVRSFQAGFGLPADGVVGAETWRVLCRQTGRRELSPST